MNWTREQALATKAGKKTLGVGAVAPADWPKNPKRGDRCGAYVFRGEWWALAFESPDEKGIGAAGAQMQGRKRETAIRQSSQRESDLHVEIMAWLAKQWPRPKWIHARMDKRSTIEIGAQDFTIFFPHGRVLCVECKRKGQKLTPAQTVWKHEMERLGHPVHTVESLAGFLEKAKI